MEDREDFTEADNLPGKPMVWPLYIEKGGHLWTFCPAKATWDHWALGVYRLLVISATTGAMPQLGGLLDQPSWFIELLAWFIPRYDEVKFQMKAQQVLGSPTAKAVTKGG